MGIKLGIQLPLVSVIVVNYNYGRYLRECVESIADQTYSNIEVVIVDNASTDNSVEIAKNLVHLHPNVRLIARAANDGQTPAALDGLKASTGPYVIFVDADDLLLPHAVETHVYVHLSLRKHVGFSSGDMFQVKDNQIVLGTENGFNRLPRQNSMNHVRPFRDIDDDFPSAAVKSGLLAELRLVKPMTSQWVWAPTSANCFRRDALDIFAANPEILKLRTGTDLYFCLGISAITGSVLIDDAVAVYRLHGGNIFSKRPQLENILNFASASAGNNNLLAKSILLKWFCCEADYFLDRGWDKYQYAKLLRAMDFPGADGKSELLKILKTEWRGTCKVVLPKRTIQMLRLSQLFFPPRW